MTKTIVTGEQLESKRQIKTLAVGDAYVYVRIGSEHATRYFYDVDIRIKGF